MGIGCFINRKKQLRKRMTLQELTGLRAFCNEQVSIGRFRPTLATKVEELVYQMDNFQHRAHAVAERQESIEN